MTEDQIAQQAYAIMRGSSRAPQPPPHWDALLPGEREELANLVVIIRGLLQGTDPAPPYEPSSSRPSQ